MAPLAMVPAVYIGIKLKIDDHLAIGFAVTGRRARNDPHHVAQRLGHRYY